MIKKLFLILILVLIIAPLVAQTTEKNSVTTYFLIRHAEKDRSNATDKNPSLTVEGKLRARKWAKIFEQFHIDEVYSTDYHRTFLTAEPTASINSLTIQLYHPYQIDISRFINDTKGKNILVVGHSNTTPGFVNKLIGEEVYHDIDDTNNANLYIVTIKDGKISHVLIQMK